MHQNNTPFPGANRKAPEADLVRPLPRHPETPVVRECYCEGPGGCNPCPPQWPATPPTPQGKGAEHTRPAQTAAGPSVREPFRAVPRARDGRSFLRGEPSLSPRKRTGVPCCTPPLLYQRLATRPGVSSGLPVKTPAWSPPCACSASYGSSPWTTNRPRGQPHPLVPATTTNCALAVVHGTRSARPAAQHAALGHLTYSEQLPDH